MKALLSILFLALAACGYRGVGGSFVGVLPENAATTAIAEDAAAYLAEGYPPGHTSLFLLTPEKDAMNAFSTAFDTALRSKGFTLSASGSGALEVAYTLDSLQDEKGDENAWYLQLRLSDGQAVARSYDSSGTPEAGRSVAPLEKGMLLRAKEKTQDAGEQAHELIERTL